MRNSKTVISIRKNMFLTNGLMLNVILFIFLVTACFGFLVFSRIPKAESTLRFLSIVHRHGDRAPEITYPLDPYKGDTVWPEGMGELLPRGKVRMHNFGRFLRDRYDGFLPSKYSPGEVYVLSSDYDRCIMSAALVLAGLYPPVGIQIWKPDLSWQPIPVHTLPLACDEIINASKRCPLLSKERSERKAIIQQKLDENQDFLANISKSIGLQVTTSHELYDLSDYLSVVVNWAKADADFGNRLEPHEVPVQPIETIWPTDEGKLYTLMLLDLDAPTPKLPVLREYLHWLVVNIPEDYFMKGECIAPYLSPDTRDNPHRLVFLVFEQPTPTHINFEVVTKKAQLEHNVRGKFSWREFAKRWELGAPLAINFFQIERPDPSDRRAQINPTDSENEGGWFNF